MKLFIIFEHLACVYPFVVLGSNGNPDLFPFIIQETPFHLAFQLINVIGGKNIRVSRSDVKPA